MAEVTMCCAVVDVETMVGMLHHVDTTRALRSKTISVATLESQWISIPGMVALGMVIAAVEEAEEHLGISPERQPPDQDATELVPSAEANLSNQDAGTHALVSSIELTTKAIKEMPGMDLAAGTLSSAGNASNMAGVAKGKGK
ncbi:hypothetical protein ABZP36_008607 [Zizania latifolia]